MPELLKATLTLAHKSGLPKDSVSNSFWFYNPVPANRDDAALAIANEVASTYTNVIPPRTHRPAQRLSPAIADNGHTVKVYEYDMATGARVLFDEGPPIATVAFNTSEAGTGPKDSSDPLPSEVSICVSFKSLSGAVPGGGDFAAPVARRRGRIYFGPLNNASDGAGGFSHAIPAAALITEMLDYFSNLVERARDVLATPMVVYSRPFAGRVAISAEDRANAGGPFRPLPAIPARDGQAFLIDQVSCDNAWDTQRRRGEAASARTIRDAS